MDGCSAKKSTSLETLVIKNIINKTELKAKLNEIINAGKDYEFDVFACLKSLLTSSDQEIITLVIQAISELAKSEEKREKYAQKDIIEPILRKLEKEIHSEETELLKQCCRVLGNLCCDCDTARNILLESNGVNILSKLILSTLEKHENVYDEIKILASKCLLNFAIGGSEFAEGIHSCIELFHKILVLELNKDDMSDDMVSTSLMILSVINENAPEFLFDDNVNKAVLNVLRETTNVGISELCLDHLQIQAEHDSVKTLIASEKGLQLACTRLEQLIAKQHVGDLEADNSEVDYIIKQACDLIIIVLTGDEAMHMLYENGKGEVFATMEKWLDSDNMQLQITGSLAMGNFARQADYCIQMMDNGIFSKLLALFEAQQRLYEGEAAGEAGEESADSRRLQAAALAALRNLSVAPGNKRRAARAAPALRRALPRAADHTAAYRLLAALRQLLDPRQDVARQLAADHLALGSVARWGQAGDGGAAGEAPRLLARAATLERVARSALLQVEGCITCLVNMLVACHSVMQNESIIALTLMAVECLNKPPPEDYPTDLDCEKTFTSQLIKSEIGKHVAVLIETNCAKMPPEVAQNLLKFLEETSKNTDLATDYKQSKVQDSLRKFCDSRNDFVSPLVRSIETVMNAISDNGRAE